MSAVDTDGMDLGPVLRAALPGAELLACTALAGQASTRRYYRLALRGGPATLIAMRLPDDPALAFGSDEGMDGGPAVATRLPFLEVQRFLAEREVPVPAVAGAVLDRRVVLLEDLGDESFEARLEATPAEGWAPLYDAAVDTLAAMHLRTEAPSA
ncbi:MAG: hypothetical protein AAGH15_00485, partial [Myxococcota bacterium]